jgi:hypothetical protein
MKKVIALNENNNQIITTEATAQKNGWWITYDVTAKPVDEGEVSTEKQQQVPKIGQLMKGLSGHIYKLIFIAPRLVCRTCEKTGENRVGKSFYCAGHFKQLVQTQPIKRINAKQQRNSKCSCGSGKKYKHCCGKETHQPRHYFNSEYKRNSKSA